MKPRYRWSYSHNRWYRNFSRRELANFIGYYARITDIASEWGPE
jgi:hypothetical protein